MKDRKKACEEKAKDARLKEASRRRDIIKDTTIMEESSFECELGMD